MPRFHARTVCALVLSALAFHAAPARADGFISPFVGYNFGGDSANCISLSNCEEKRTNWGVSLGSMGQVFGFELDLADAKSFFGSTPGSDNSVLTLMSNLMVTIPAGPIRPYGVIGLGLVRPHARLDTSSLTTDNNALGYDIGGGMNIFLAHAIGIRGDLRRIRTLQDVTIVNIFSNEPLEFWRASAGLTFRF